MRHRLPTLLNLNQVRVVDRGRLPHWLIDGGYYAITIRLFDSLPREAVQSLIDERDRLLIRIARDSRHPTMPERIEVERLFTRRLNAWLDRGAGSCFLQDDRIAKIVAHALRYFDGDRYELIAWSVMPNHAHVLMKLFRGEDLSATLHSWKSFTSKKANRLLAREGTFWQREYFDHLIRTEAELEEQKRYIYNNPTSAGLVGWKWRWACGQGSVT